MLYGRRYACEPRPLSHASDAVRVFAYSIAWLTTLRVWIASNRSCACDRDSRLGSRSWPVCVVDNIMGVGLEQILCRAPAWKWLQIDFMVCRRHVCLLHLTINLLGPNLCTCVERKFLMPRNF
ncbi:uncharacterized protein LOC131306949 [Rhododendron vialii]|uniref:uncharacterized protein LOC131306949 n=1 Tax=Rhododendron vialii TaxID=182163 RepID=UPI00265F8EC9|nr:uncharacterized protein LOC131306949 [Rhododendron vialii]